MCIISDIIIILYLIDKNSHQITSVDEKIKEKDSDGDLNIWIWRFEKDLEKEQIKIWFVEKIKIF